MTRARLLADLRALFALALPVTVSRVGIMGLALVDTIMVGQYSSDDLAYLAVGQVPANVFILALIGLMLGTSVLASNYFGAGRFTRAGEIWWRSLPYAFFWGLVGLIICANGEWILLVTGQAPEVAAAGGRYSTIIGLSLPLAALHITSGFFLEGIRRVRPGMVIMIFANIVNAIANYVFVYGHFGMPELGADGAAWATLATRVMQVGLIFTYIWYMADHEKYGVRRPPKPSWSAGKQMRNIGYASGISLGLENLAFQSLALFAGLISKVVAAAHIVTINVFALFFMLGLGISTATGVRVGNAYGAADMDEVSRFAWFGAGVQVCVMFFFSVLLYVAATPIARVFAADPAVVSLSAQLVAYSAFALIFDTAQTLMAQVCRARGDSWFPALGHFVSYALVMVPASYLAVFFFERGAFGLVDGIIIGSLTSLFIMGGRFLFLDRYRRTPAVFR